MAEEIPVRYVTAGGLTVCRLEPAIGAQIEGIDLRQPISDRHATDIRQALLDHGVIFFRDQPLSYDQHVTLAAIFGEVWVEAVLPEKPCVLPLQSDHGSFNPAGGHWHSDGTYLPVPPAVSVLRCHKAAPLGGDTLFSSATAVWDKLPADMQERIAPLWAKSSMSHIRKVKQLDDMDPDFYNKDEGPRIPDWAEHPVVRVHPDTGRPYLYLNEVHFFEITGLPKGEGDALMHELVEHFHKPENQVRWKWTDDAIAIWDNRAVQHYAVQDEAGPRYVERIMTHGVPSVSLADHRKMAPA
ncbi:MAG: TauD/TfdA dioxygenase family protein [Novosphingobium sp.]